MKLVDFRDGGNKRKTDTAGVGSGRVGSGKKILVAL